MLATLLGGLGIALYFCWQLALVVMACIPIIAVAGALQMKLMSGFSHNKAYEVRAVLWSPRIS